MSSKWKEAVALVESLDEARREEIAKRLMRIVEAWPGSVENIHTLIDEAEDDIALARTEPGGPSYWNARRAELRELLASKT